MSIQSIMSSTELSPLVTLFFILVGVVVLVVLVAIAVDTFSRRAYRENYAMLKEHVEFQDKTIESLKSQMNSALLQYSKLIEELREEVEVLRWYVTEEGLPVPKDRRHAAELMARRKDEIDMAKRMKTEVLEDDFQELRDRARTMRLDRDRPRGEQRTEPTPYPTQAEPKRKM